MVRGVRGEGRERGAVSKDRHRASSLASFVGRSCFHVISHQVMPWNLSTNTKLV